jgi:hypothetical protein
MLIEQLRTLKNQHVALEYTHPHRSMYYGVDGWVVAVIGREGAEVLVLAVASSTQVPQQVPVAADPGMPMTQSNVVAGAMDTLLQYRFKFIPVAGIILLEAHGGIECRWNPQNPGEPAKLSRGGPARPAYPLLGQHKQSEQWEALIMKAWDEHLLKLGLVEAAPVPVTASAPAIGVSPVPAVPAQVPVAPEPVPA